ARVRLDQVRREKMAERYDVILVDAFSSDAIPVHLLTREALRLYLDMLAPDGIVALHVGAARADLRGAARPRRRPPLVRDAAHRRVRRRRLDRRPPQPPLRPEV